MGKFKFEFSALEMSASEFCGESNWFIRVSTFSECVYKSSETQDRLYLFSSFRDREQAFDLLDCVMVKGQRTEV